MFSFSPTTFINTSQLTPRNFKLTGQYDVDPVAWNDDAKRLDGCAFHSYEWSIFASEKNPERPVYFRLEDESGKTQALAVGYQQSKKLGGRTFFKTLSFGSFPACREPGLQETAIRRIIDYCRKAGIMELSIHSFGTPFQTQVLSEMGFSTTRRWEFLLDLPETEEALWGRIHSKKRNLIRKGQKEGVRIVTALGLDQLIQMRNLAAETQKRKEEKGISFPSPDEKYYQLMKQRLIDSGLGRLYLAFDGEEPIASAFFVGFNRKAYYMLSAADEEGLKKAAPDLILWTAMTDYLREGYKLFNLGGLSERELNGGSLEESGLFHFKKRFSSQECLCYTGLFRVRPFQHSLFQFMKAIRSRVNEVIGNQ
jgi:hypothetical protein